MLPLGPTTVLSEGLKNIIDAMKEHNVELISVCLSGNNWEKNPKNDKIKHLLYSKTNYIHIIYLFNYFCFM